MDDTCRLIINSKNFYLEVKEKNEKRSRVSILLFVLLFTSIVLTTIPNNVYGKDNNEDEIEEEERERNEAGDHWLGGIIPDESPTADKESDLSYIMITRCV